MKLKICALLLLLLIAVVEATPSSRYEEKLWDLERKVQQNAAFNFHGGLLSRGEASNITRVCESDKCGIRI